jgi:hypothetical protein
MMLRGDHLPVELQRLADEANTVLNALVLPGWGGPRHGMPDTLFGYMMSLFARIDLYAAYWRGSFAGQSLRMVDFMEEYMSVGRTEASLALQFWRHKLMHTSAPRELRDPLKAQSYRWLLHWSDEHLPREQHFKLQGNGLILNLSLVGLIDHTQLALSAYLSALRTDGALQAKFDAVELELSAYEFRAI